MATTAGYYPTLMEVVPPFSGLLLGVSDTFAYSSSIFAALIVGYNTPGVGEKHFRVAYIVHTDECTKLIILTFLIKLNSNNF